MNGPSCTIFGQIGDGKLGIVFHDAAGVADQVCALDGLYPAGARGEAFAAGGLALRTVAFLHVGQPGHADGDHVAEPLRDEVQADALILHTVVQPCRSQDDSEWHHEFVLHGGDDARHLGQVVGVGIAGVLSLLRGVNAAGEVHCVECEVHVSFQKENPA